MRGLQRGHPSTTLACRQDRGNLLISSAGESLYRSRGDAPVPNAMGQDLTLFDLTVWRA